MQKHLLFALIFLMIGTISIDCFIGKRDTANERSLIGNRDTANERSFIGKRDTANEK